MKKPTKPPVEISLAVEKVNGNTPYPDIIEAGNSLNLAILSKRTMDQLDEIGVKLDESGVIQFGNKCAAVTAQAVLKGIVLISEGMVTPKDAERAAAPLAQLSKAMTMIVGNMSDTVVERGGQTPVAHKEKAFPAGKITSLTQININQAQNNSAKPA